MKGLLGKLWFLCAWYFAMYVMFGDGLKWLLDKRPGFPGVGNMEVLFLTTVGGMSICLAVVMIRRWHRHLESADPKGLWGILPIELAWIIPAGICAAFVIPTTTLMYSFGYSVMVAMVMMRSSLVIIGRVVDAILIKQGHSDKKVLWPEEAAWMLAACALSVVIFMAGGKDFHFLESPAAVITMLCYIVPYGFRVYIMSRSKLKIDHRAYIGYEQYVATIVVVLASAAVIIAVKLGWNLPQAVGYTAGYDMMVTESKFAWAAIGVGVLYGLVMFPSVFLYLHKKGSATFNVTVNRLTSLIAGTVATLIYWIGFGGKPVETIDWIALGIIVTAILFLGLASKMRHDQEEKR